MAIKIKTTNQNLVTLDGGNNKIVASSLTPGTLSSLDDVDFTGIQDNYVLQYNASLGKIVAVDPDQILSDAVPGGIPGDFINALDTDTQRLDNVDFDGGIF